MVPVQFALPPNFRLRGWIGNPAPHTWVDPHDGIDSLVTALDSFDAKLIVEVEPADEPAFPAALSVDGSESVEWILFTHFKS